MKIMFSMVKSFGQKIEKNNYAQRKRTMKRPTKRKGKETICYWIRKQYNTESSVWLKE